MNPPNGPHNGRQTNVTDRSVPEVIRAIVTNIGEIAHSEFLLTKTQINEEMSGAANAAKSLVAGTVFAFYALGFLLLAAWFGLSRVMAPWLAAMVVAVAVGIIAISFVTVGKSRLREHAESMKRFVEKEEAKW